jgi:hypothetical protein
MSSIPLPPPIPPSETENKNDSAVTIEEVKTDEKKVFFFADEIKINDQTVLTIPLDNMFYEEEKPKRKSRWGDRPEKKSKKKFNFLSFLMKYLLFSFLNSHQSASFTIILF